MTRKSKREIKATLEGLGNQSNGESSILAFERADGTYAGANGTPLDGLGETCIVIPQQVTENWSETP